MLKSCLLIITTLVFSFSHAQVDPAKVKKHIKDTATKKNAAKADRHVARDKSIFDTSPKKPKGQ
jgi:hypothetical protein